jgi:hypothetical protein
MVDVETNRFFSEGEASGNLEGRQLPGGFFELVSFFLSLFVFPIIHELISVVECCRELPRGSDWPREMSPRSLRATNSER